MTVGKEFICAHFLEGQNYLLKKNNEKMNLEIIILEK